MVFVSAFSLAASFSHAQEVGPTDPHVRNGRPYVGPVLHPGATKPSFTLALSPGTRDRVSSEFRVGSKVRVTVKMTNITDHAIDHSGAFSDAGDMAYSYDVRDEDGKPAARIVSDHPERVMPSPFWSDIPPGDSNLDQLRLNLVYKFDRPGKYTVQVSRHDPDCLDENGKPVVVKSNIVTITITG
jgi:hypothetical protein